MKNNIGIITILYKSANKKMKFLFVFAIFLTLLGSLISLIIPLELKEILTSHSSFNSFLITIIPLTVLIVLSAIIEGIAGYFLMKFGAYTVKKIRIKLIENTIHLPIDYFKNNSYGESVSHIVNDTGLIGQMATTVLPNFISNTVICIGSFIFLFILNWMGTLIILTSIPLLILVITIISKLSSKLAGKTQENIANINSMFFNSLKRLNTIKVNVTEQKEITSIVNKVNTLYSLSLKQSKILSFVSPLISMIMIIIILIEFVYGAFELKSGLISIGTLLAYFIYLFQIINPLNVISGLTTTIANINGATEKVMSLLNALPEKLELGLRLTDPINSLKINELSFKYYEENILHSLNIHAEKGEKIAIVGPSGAGKTTIFNLIERLYNIPNNTVLINEKDSNEYSLESLRSQISIASQNTDLIPGTITSNIIYGQTFNKEKLNKILNTDLMKFITKFPDKEEHRINDENNQLSGGEIQRIGLARALYKNSSILLLDEVTANLDAESENLINNIINIEKETKLILIIAHRLSTIINADRIYFIENGYITGEGTHSYLYKNHLLYKKYVDTQSISVQ